MDNHFIKDVQQNMNFLSTILNHVPFMVGLFDKNETWIFANDNLVNFLRIKDYPYLGKHCSELLKFNEVNQECLLAVKDQFDRMKLDHLEDEPSFLLNPTNCYSPHLKHFQFHSIEDGWLMVGDLQEESGTAWDTNQALEALILNSPLAIISFDHDGIIKTWNPAAELIFGWSSSELIGSHIPLISEDEEDEFGDLLGMMLQGKALTDVEFRCKKKNGELIDISLSITLLLDKTGDISGGMAVITDITKRKEAEQIIKHMAYFDTLTGLPNRNLFYDRLHQALKQAKRKQSSFAVLFLDLDRFKVINDSLGHTCGDLLLQLVANRLKSCIREVDTIARQGGDEFTALLIDISPEDVVYVANRMLNSLSEPFSINGQDITITPSIGISLYPSNGEDIESLIKHADTAMYRAKEQGRNNYQIYAEGMSSKLSNRLELENSLRRALSKDEFILYYQPQFQIHSGEMIGIEALIRWDRPGFGFVPPSSFIPLAEETGLIIPIGEWVLRTACKQNKKWQDAGYPPVRVCVNISAQQFKQANIVETIENILIETGLSPAYLELEITENISMSDIQLTSVILDRLKKMGVKISIDDFGTGYSSLSYLKKFPIDTIKIDQSFVQDIQSDADDAAIVRAIMAMAHSLDLNVIAEGVETKEQLTFLEQQRCNEVQGFLLMKPLSVPELEKAWRNGK